MFYCLINLPPENYDNYKNTNHKMFITDGKHLEPVNQHNCTITKMQKTKLNHNHIKYSQEITTLPEQNCWELNQNQMLRRRLQSCLLQGCSCFASFPLKCVQGRNSLFLIRSYEVLYSRKNYYEVVSFFGSI